MARTLARATGSPHPPAPCDRPSRQDGARSSWKERAEPPPGRRSALRRTLRELRRPLPEPVAPWRSPERASWLGGGAPGPGQGGAVGGTVLREGVQTVPLFRGRAPRGARRSALPRHPASSEQSDEAESAER